MGGCLRDVTADTKFIKYSYKKIYVEVDGQMAMFGVMKFVKKKLKIMRDECHLVVVRRWFS